MKALAIAFSLYSRIPMPVFPWEEKDKKYAICWFPAVGIPVGILFFLAFCVVEAWKVPSVLKGAVLTAVPVFVTGGIHMDGFLDTCDARASFGSREKKLEILKDSHTGAFAVIYGCLYLLFLFSFYSILTRRGAVLTSVGFVVSRSLSGLASAVLPNARASGMLADLTRGSERRVTMLFMAGFLFLSGGWLLTAGAAGGGLVLLASAAVWFRFRRMAIKEFGGITGDLAGYFLQVCELAIAAAAALPALL